MEYKTCQFWGRRCSTPLRYNSLKKCIPFLDNIPLFAYHIKITITHNTVPYCTVIALVPTQKRRCYFF